MSEPAAPTTIGQILARLTGILDGAIEPGERIGYFAGLYLRVTWSVKRAILAGDVFENNERMEQLDVIFASRFLDAWDTWNAGDKPTSPWKMAFENLDNGDLMVVQHLLLAMNAHIDLDLGIAAEETMRERGEPLEGLKSDFDLINVILQRLIGIVMVQLGELSTTFADLEELAPGLEGLLFHDVLDGLRDGAWHLAERLDGKRTQAGRDLVITEREALTDAASEVILKAPGFGSFVAEVASEEAANGVPFNIQIVAE